MTNNVINQIASDVDRYFTQNDIDKLSHSYEWEQLYAEAIIKECLRRIQGTHLANGYDTTSIDEYEQGYKKGVEQCFKMVKQHFGVE